MSGLELARLGGFDLCEEELAWQEDAACAESRKSHFFPEAGDSTTTARRICFGCEVRLECLHYALGNRIAHGVWGGVGERERRRIHKGSLAVSTVLNQPPPKPKRKRNKTGRATAA